ncbi:PQ-loop repeat-containing protein 1 [Thelohanellus kitauei]|uniref:PQ-loop repeat-containing protein 1 n=1 Tax=Thelohanellus kitauei TaxID=669202 RepID=A0A0C2N8V0_THEKT|nr:PQ-loop repeat-containing protein 1 [Thelohanellus kitauei]
MSSNYRPPFFGFVDWPLLVRKLVPGMRLADIMMVALPPIPYMVQVSEMHRKKSSAGFSKLVCYILLISSLLKIAFWFKARYEFALFVQSVVLIITTLTVLYFCYKYSPSTKLDAGVDRFQRLFTRLLLAYGALQLVSIFVVIFLPEDSKYVQMFGSTSGLIEAFITVPQLFHNFRRKSVKGLRFSVIMMWLCGDIFKLYYLLTARAPYQFVYCCIFQTAVDSLIFLQVFKYHSHLE